VIAGSRNTETVEKSELPPQKTSTESVSANNSDAGEDDTMSYFSKLADDE
jgi:hypothetical protein